MFRHVSKHVFRHVSRHVFRHVFKHACTLVFRHVLRHVYASMLGMAAQTCLRLKVELPPVDASLGASVELYAHEVVGLALEQQQVGVLAEAEHLVAYFGYSIEYL